MSPDLKQPEAPAPPAAAEAPPAAPSIRDRAVQGVGWTAFIQGYRVAAGLLTTWILAFLVDRDEFGLVAGASAVVGFLLLLRDLGTGSAIVHRRDLPQETLSSIFWTNVLLGAGGTLALVLAAPLIAWAIGDPALVPVTRGLSVTVLFAGLGVTHQCLLQRDLRFARLARIEAFALTAGAAAGIGAALLGAGVWALVAQSVLTMGLSSALALALCGWRPSLCLRLADVRSVAKFSLNLTGFNVLNYALRSADQLLVLRVLGKTEAGLYYLAIKLLLFPISSVNAVLSRVLFPLFARIQDDDARLRNAYLKVTAAIATLVLPFLVGFAVTADSLVAATLPPALLPLVPVALALTVVAALQSLATSTGSIYLAKGRTDVMLVWGVLACATGLTGYAVGVQWGTVGVARAYAVVSVLLFWPALKLPLGLIDTPLREFFAVVWRPVAAALCMGAVVWSAGALLGDVTPWVDLAIRVPLGVLSYVAFSAWLNREMVGQLLTLARTGGRPAGEVG